MPRRAAVLSTDLDRVLTALKKAGMAVARVDIQPGGAVSILTGDGDAHEVRPLSELDAWRAQKNGPRAAQGT